MFRVRWRAGKVRGGSDWGNNVVWECKKCHEQIEDSFEVCWNCGASEDGIEDPSFCKEDDLEVGPDVEDLDQELSRRFRCAKCQAEGAVVKRIATTGTGLSKILDIQHHQFIAVSCRQCGYTELYRSDILEGQSSGMNILDLLFGR